MRILRPLVFLLTLLVYGPILMLPQTSDLPEAEIRSVMAQLRNASLEGDADKVSSLMADEYLQTDISGHVQDKQTWLKEYFCPLADLIKAGKFRWEVYERKDVEFRVYGESVVVIGALEAKGSGARWMPEKHAWASDPSAVFSGTLRFTHIYVKRNGRWLLAALQNAVPVSSTPAK